jgi:hypothetical protein
MPPTAYSYYRKDGRCMRVTPAINACIKYLRDWYRRKLAADFGPLALKAVRQRMVDDGLSRSVVATNPFIVFTEDVMATLLELP